MSLRLLRIATLLAVTGTTLAGCGGIMRTAFKEQPLPATLVLDGLQAPASISRDSLGIPLVEAATMDDMLFAQGFTAARDRQGQMLGLRLMAQGRLAEMVGEAVLDIDRYMRAQDMRRSAQIAWDAASPEMQRYLQRYAAGVNAYLAHQAPPADIKLSGYTPEPWTPLDSLAVSELVNFALSQNLHEEIAFLRHAQALGVEKAAWLHPIYPDEPLPFDEAKKLAGVDLNAASAELQRLLVASERINSMGLAPLAASNNWVVHKSRTSGGASLLANDTHLLLSQPSFWHYAQLRAPGFAVAGVAIAGLPGVMAGYNGHLAWGMTMVMADNQDVYLEQLRSINGSLHYLYRNQWLPCTTRSETFRIRGGKAVTETFLATRHGVLLNRALQSPPKSDLNSPQLELAYGIALQKASFEPDRSADAFLDLSRSQSVAEALPHARQIRVTGLNLLLADRDNIAWQVTGRYPKRKQGLGLLPSPGWSGDYDWDGYLDPGQHPFVVNPEAGYFSTANNRKLPAEASHAFSAAWYFPERGERADQLLAARNDHSTATAQAMQLDRHSLLVGKFVANLNPPAALAALQAAIDKLPPARQATAREALAALRQFDGNLTPESAPAAIWGAFLTRFTLATFADELGPTDGQLWQAFLTSNDTSYGAIDDHLLGREGSPFWDDIRTPQRETRADVLAAALADSIALLENRLGNDRQQWAWGKLHTYTWQTEGSKLARHLGTADRWALSMLDGFFNRGPVAAGGDHTTLNVSSYRVGENFHTWLVPAMRVVVDFSRDEPMQAINSSGQSGNPASEHYADGNQWWLEGRYQPFPFRPEALRQHYRLSTRLMPANAAASAAAR